MINKLSLTVSNNETFGTFEVSPTDNAVKISDDYIEIEYYVDWKMPNVSLSDELIRGREVNLRCVTKISFDEVAKAALYEDGSHVKRGTNILSVAYKDSDVYEAIEAAGKHEYLKNQVIAAYSIMGNEDKHLRVF